MTNSGTAAPRVGLISRASGLGRWLGCVQLTDEDFLRPVHITCGQCGTKFVCDAESKAAADKICVKCLPPPSNSIPMFFWDDKKLN
jgi:hypothetical protein